MRCLEEIAMSYQQPSFDIGQQHAGHHQNPTLQSTVNERDALRRYVILIKQFSVYQFYQHYDSEINFLKDTANK